MRQPVCRGLRPVLVEKGILVAEVLDGRHDVLSNLYLCILNDGSNTYLHPGNDSYSSTDLTIVDPSLFLDLQWSVHDNFCGCDHYPIILEDRSFENRLCTYTELET